MPSTSPGRFLPRGLSLRTKSFLFVGSVVLTLTAALLVLVSTVFLESMTSMQTELTKELIDSVVNQLNQAARQQRNKAIDSAGRDEIFALLKGKQRGYLGKNDLFQSIFAGQDIVLLFDRQKNPFAWFFLPERAREGKELPAYLHADEARHSRLLQEGKTGSVILTAPDGLLMLSAHPVIHTDGSGPSPGWLVYGLDLGTKWFEEMKELTGVNVSPFVPDERETRGNRREGKTLITDALGTCRVFLYRGGFSGGSPDETSAVIEFENAAGTPSAGLRLKFSSAVYSAAGDLRNKLAWNSIIGGIVLTVFCCLAIEHLFIRKISQMDREFQTLVGNKDSLARLQENSRDEFGRLAGSANRLLDSLRRQRTESESQKTLLLSVLDSASEGVMAFRSLRNERGAIADFILVLANKSAEAMLNRSSGDMLGKCLLGLFPATMTEGIFDRYVQVVETKAGDHFETFYSHEEMRRWLYISAEPWSDGFVVTFEEISQRKRVEQELKASIEELERFNRAMIGRESRILEMKSEVNLLRSRMGLPPGYKVDALNDDA
ncbi:MAG: PAS domain-containing protein [Verrucomicrobia bacterium]|nr:PAS domain-containing protein [Verrucomicrobiota bacterium]